MTDILIMAGIAGVGYILGLLVTFAGCQARFSRLRRQRNDFADRLTEISALEPGPRGNGTARKMAKIARGEQ